MSVDHRALIDKLAGILGRNEWEALPEVFAPDAILEFPQSGEAFRGIRNLRGQFEGYPGGLAEGRIDAASVAADQPTYAVSPGYTVVAMEGSGRRGSATFRTTYPDGSTWWAIIHYEVDADRISRAKGYFAPEFEAPAWRAKYREPE